MPVRMIQVANPPEEKIRVYEHRGKGGHGRRTYLHNRKFISETNAKALIRRGVGWEWGKKSKGGKKKRNPSRRAASSPKRSTSMAQPKKSRNGKKKAAAKPRIPKHRRGQKPVAGFKAMRKSNDKKKSGYNVYKSKRKTKGGSISTYHAVRVNPSSPVKSVMEALKRGSILFGGLVGIRVANGLIKEYVVGKPGVDGLLKGTSSTSALAKAAPYLPALGGFILGVFVVPRVIKNKEWSSVLQAGGVVGLLDSVLSNFVIPKLQEGKTSDDFMYKVGTYLGVGAEGPNEMGVYPEGVDYYPDEIGDGVGADPHAVRPRTSYGTGLFVRN